MIVLLWLAMNVRITATEMALLVEPSCIASVFAVQAIAWKEAARREAARWDEMERAAETDTP